MAKNHMDELHAKVLKKFHTLCSITGKTADEKQAIIEGYGVGSSADIQTHDLINLCGVLQKELDKRDGGKIVEMDTLRKRCIRCLCDYIDTRGLKAENKVEYAKQIACRSTQRPGFNQITAAELRGLIGGFNKERKALEGATREAEIDALLVSCGQGKYRILGEA